MTNAEWAAKRLFEALGYENVETKRDGDVVTVTYDTPDKGGDIVTDLEQAKKALQDAQAAERDVDGARHRLRLKHDDQIQELRERLAREMELEYGPAKRDAAEAVAKAQTAYDEALAKESVASGPPFPDVVYVEWRKQYGIGQWYQAGPRAKQVIYRAAEGSVCSWGRPTEGGWCLRHLRKNGAFGKRVTGIKDWSAREYELPRGWFAEGVNPNKEGK